MSDVRPEDAFGLLRSFLRHRAFVELALGRVARALDERAIEHDLTKMLDDEFAGFSRINAAARIQKFGSPEYAENMRRERGTIDLHFSRNSHHPEQPGLLAQQTGGTALIAYDAGISEHEMTFLDVIEMVCDWWGASKGYDDPRAWQETVQLNLEQKGKYLSPAQRWLVEQVAAFLAPYVGEVST